MEHALASTPAPLSGSRRQSHWLTALERQRSGDTEAAIRALEHHLLQSPDDAGAWMSLGTALRRAARFDAALVCYQRALRLCPRDAGIWSSLGRLWAELGQFEQGLRAHRRAVELDPARIATRIDCAAALREACRLDEAERLIDSCLRQEPGRRDLQLERGLLRLQLGRLREGWADYAALVEPPLPPSLAAIPRWQGERIAGKRILLTSGPDAGTTLWAARYVGMLTRRGAACSLLVEPAMHRVLGALPARAASEQQLAAASEHFDLRCPLETLAALVDPRVATIPAPFEPKLAAPPAWLRDLVTADHRVLHVGIAWHGGAGTRESPVAAPPLTLFLALALLPGVRLYSLQHDAAGAALAQNGGTGLLTDLGSRCEDLADLAGAMSLMDVCILADGTAAHLAGCLGKPSLTLLPFRPHWLYGLRGENTTWYPASRLLRQPAPGDWNSVMRDATALLRGWSKVRVGSADTPTTLPVAGDTP